MRSRVDKASLRAEPALAEVAPPSETRRLRLRAHTVPVHSLDKPTIDAAFELFDSLYAGADRARFERDLSEKQLIILLLDHADGALRGFSTVHFTDITHAGRPARLIYSGDTAIHPAYWGQKRLQRAFSSVIAREKLRHPTKPLLWFLISKGYKTYLLLIHHFPRSVPRVDRQEDADLRATLGAVAASRFGDDYDATRGVVSYASVRERVRGQVAPIDRPLMASNPHVAFFAAHNPGYERGDELACLAEIRLRDPITTIVGSWRGARRGRRTK